MKSKLIINNKLFYILSFLIPVILFFIILGTMNIFPFGNYSFFSNDAVSQYIPFHTELAEKLQTGESLFYSFSNGMGTDFFSEISYYLASPFNLFLFFVPLKYVPLYLLITLTLKCGLAGLSMCFYLKRHFKYQNSLYLISISCCYALSSYFLNYYYHVMWIDCFFLFPVLVLTIEYLYEGRKKYLYSIVLGICILSNFYIGFMLCIFCVLYYTYLILSDSQKINIKIKLHKIYAFLFYSLLAGGLVAFILLPTVFTVFSSATASQEYTNNPIFYYPWYISLFRMMVSANPTYMHYPYLCSTILAFLLVPQYFTNKKYNLRKKVSFALLLLCLLLSFQTRFLDYFWNGCHIINGFAGRQSFIFIFLILLLCYEVLENKEINKRVLLISLAGIIAVMYLIKQHLNFTSTFNSLVLNLILIIIMYIILRFKIHFTPILLCIIIGIELVFAGQNGLSIGDDFNDYEKDYESFKNNINNINDDSFFRTVNTSEHFLNSGVTYDFNSISTYTSFMNKKVAETLLSLGYYVSINGISSFSYEPLTLSIFSNKYIISNNQQNYDYELLTEYKNNNDIMIYKNNSALSVGFLTIKNSLKNVDFSNECPFLIINEIVEKTTGISSLYTPHPAGSPIPDGYEIYLYSKKELIGAEFITAENQSEKLYNEDIPFMYFVYRDNYISKINLGNQGGQIVSDKDLSNTYVYLLDIEKLNKAISILSESQIDITSHSDSKMSGKINANYSGTIFTSIPYSKGWSVKIDGKEVKTYSTLNDTFLAFDIKKGKHTIELNYVSPGFKTGILISLITCFILIITIIKNHAKSS